MQLRRFIFAVLGVCLFTSASMHAQFAHTQGKEIVDGSGKPLLLRGINLGNWLIPEGYMWHFDGGGPESPREIEAVVTELIGPERARAFWKSYRDNYISQADIHLIHQSGFNSIRVPLHYKFFETEDAEGFVLLEVAVPFLLDVPY